MTTVQVRVARKAEIHRRLKVAQSGFASCAVLDCGHPPTAKAKSGLSKSYCRHHVEHYRRHGSYSKRSYPIAVLNPHRQSAWEWLQAHQEHVDVAAAVNQVRALLQRSGQPLEAFRLSGLSPEDRARNTWARLRKFGVDPLALLAAWVAVCLCHRHDLQPERKVEFRWVQGAKLAHRMAGGTHKRWEREDGAGKVQVTELHKYPVSRGRVLRHIGEAMAIAAAPLNSVIELIDAPRSSDQPSARHRMPRVKTRG